VSAPQPSQRELTEDVLLRETLAHLTLPYGRASETLISSVRVPTAFMSVADSIPASGKPQLLCRPDLKRLNAVLADTMKARCSSQP